jgi:outer membrane protein OmpA-like peptidoglycan-associated protein
MKKTLFSIIILLGLSVNAFSQDKSRKEIKGDKYYFIYAFDDAIDAYLDAKVLTVSGQRYLAESYKNTRQIEKAEASYLALVKNLNGVLPIDYYNYAMILKSKGNYTESDVWMDKYVGQKPNDLRAMSYTANKSKFNELSNDNANFKLLKLGINSDEKDFGPAYFNDKIVFTSTRAKVKMIKRKNNWDGKPYLDLYQADVDKRELSNVEKFNKQLKSKFNIGSASFSNKGTNMAFTRNKARDKSEDRIVELQIFLSSMKDGEWTEPVAFSLNNVAYSVGQPCLSEDGKTMFFTSDMPGGFGGSDLYKTTRAENGEWNKAENLGNQINTEGNESFAFCDEKNNMLYFASDGHYGIGGLDVFSCSMTNAKVNNVINLGKPVNSKEDDFSFILDKLSMAGYFASNRLTGEGDDDLYAFDMFTKKMIQKRIQGVSFDQNTGFLPNTLVKLLDEAGNQLAMIMTTDAANYTFNVETDKKYKLNGSKSGYYDGNQEASSYGEDSIIYADVILTYINKVEVKDLAVGDDLSKLTAGNPKTIYFDYNRYFIRPDAAIELDKIVKIMNDNPTMVVELRSYTDCRASDFSNQILSDNRAKSSAEYIQKSITKPMRIYGKGYGESILVNNCKCEDTLISDCSDSEHQKNRRTEFIIINK